MDDGTADIRSAMRRLLLADAAQQREWLRLVYQAHMQRFLGTAERHRSFQESSMRVMAAIHLELGLGGMQKDAGRRQRVSAGASLLSVRAWRWYLLLGVTLAWVALVLWAHCGLLPAPATPC
ncbi:MAG: hypothetical protein AB1505_27685 [Candidatus Latescibacterota bacterium]